MPSSVRIVKGALVCDGAVLTGDITIGSTTVIFPGAKIQCSEGAGPITIGSGCVVEEGATIVNMNPDEMHIGDGNLFEVGCTVYAKKVGWLFGSGSRGAQQGVSSEAGCVCCWVNTDRGAARRKLPRFLCSRRRTSSYEAAHLL